MHFLKISKSKQNKTRKTQSEETNPKIELNANLNIYKFSFFCETFYQHLIRLFLCVFVLIRLNVL